ncbi:Holliday junction branch migration protein RuvA [Novosphingobium sp. KACC 22771]|uniref:Holliday junction branch migration protein RuvA n=1 Tax=Novosphingobium sp. KACC 22771 TaxID=3025670 RepID=UPI002366CBB1|nr:Holliday junction branch migration protein RuvA [Novosphingobium sp. KACC 22771]WDF72941.1 Holliday junction branch migration protein RuvA [Novosphingobium sp. KACC 22771]
MIAKLTGILDDFGPDWAVIDVNGVGYLVFCSGRTLAALGIRGDACTVYTEMQVSETDMRLIGFTSAGERAWFKLLTVVQGVGSKVALAILSALTVEELQRACAGGDAAMVARANGVGPKLAARIVNELKDKAGALPTGPAGAAVSAGVAMPEGNVAGDVVSALQNLGFKPNIAASATDAAIAELGEEAGVSALIRVALKKAAG